MWLEEVKSQSLSLSLLSPYLVPLCRDVADHVIYNAQKAQRAGKKGVHLKKPSVDKSVVCEKRLHNIRTGELTTLRMFEDSDDSTDDESDPFHDILTF